MVFVKVNTEGAQILVTLPYASANVKKTLKTTSMVLVQVTVEESVLKFVQNSKKVSI